VAISDPATAHFRAYKNLGNTRIAYKPRHMHTHTHPETLEAREKPRWQLVTQLLTDHNTQGGTKHQYKIHTNTQWHTNTIAYRNNDTTFLKLILLPSSGENI
jgi:hypothetical protein